MSVEFVRVYDLHDPGAWRAAHLHRNLWGKLYTDVHTLDAGHIALVFSTGGARWREWEQVRLQWIIAERR